MNDMFGSCVKMLIEFHELSEWGGESSKSGHVKTWLEYTWLWHNTLRTLAKSIVSNVAC